MSIRRSEEDFHVFVKGTMVSTLWTHPSKLHVSVVKSFGLPNAENKIMTNDHILALTYDKTNDSIVHVWAQPRSYSPTPWERASSCSIS